MPIKHPMTKIRVAMATLLLALAVPAPARADSIWDALREPGAMVVLRHSAAPGSVDLSPATR